MQIKNLLRSFIDYEEEIVCSTTQNISTTQTGKTWFRQWGFFDGQVMCVLLVQNLGTVGVQTVVEASKDLFAERLQDMKTVFFVPKK